MFSKIARGVIIFAEPSNNDPSRKEKTMQVSRPIFLAAPQDDPVTFVVGASTSEERFSLRR